MNFQMFKLDLEKAEEPEIKLPTSTGSSKKQESSKKVKGESEVAVAIPFSRGSSQTRNQTQVPCIAGRFFTIWATREAINR